MTQLTIGRRLVRAGSLALAAVLFTIILGASALARNRYQIEVSVQTNVHRNVAYAVTVIGFSTRKEKAVLFVDYASCGSTPAVEVHRLDAELAYTVKGAFSKVSGWKSSLARRDHACAYLVDRKTGRVLARGSRTYPVR